MNVIPVKTHEELVNLKSALTWEGLKLDDETFSEINEWMAHYGAKMKTDNIYLTKGADMNAAEGLTGKNAYPSDLSIVSIKLEDIENAMALAIPRFQVGGRWMDDILENNRRKQEEE